MRRGVVLVLTEEDIEEIFVTYSLEMLCAKASGMDVDKMRKVLAKRTLRTLVNNSDTNYAG